MKIWRRWMQVEGKRVLITGASSGIGSALASVLARKRATLVLTSRRHDRLEEVAKRIADAFPHSPTPLALPCDVTDRENVRGLAERCVDHLAGIDIWINNAGISVYGDTEKTTMDDFHSVMSVNFFGAVHCMLEVIPLMKRQGEGLIVNIASVAAKHGVPYLGVYCASKAALEAVSQSLRAELSGTGVSIMLVYPGYTQTDIFRNEKNVGGGRRPRGPFAPASKVAEAIVRAMEREKHDLVLTLEGRALALLSGLLPRLVGRSMAKLAAKLRDTHTVKEHP
jgi:short-subunit dehydrogenase